MSKIIACDEQLILQYRQNNKEAYDCLLKRKARQCLPLLRKYENQCKPFGGNIDDLYSIFYESFHRAVLRYIFDGITFQTYFLKVLNRDLAGYYRYLTQPSKASYSFLSLDQEITYASNLTFHDVINTDEQRNDFRGNINTLEALKILDDLPISKKDDETKRIILLKAFGYSINEIARYLNLNPPAVRRRIKDFYTSELGERIREHLL